MTISTTIKEVCKIGQGKDCCRYLTMGPNGFECAKLNLGLMLTIDARVESMNAKGDNCEGKEDLG